MAAGRLGRASDMMAPWRSAILTLAEEGRVPKYVIERELPGAGALSPEELQGISQKSCGVLKGLGLDPTTAE